MSVMLRLCMRASTEVSCSCGQLSCTVCLHLLLNTVATLNFPTQAAEIILLRRDWAPDMHKAPGRSASLTKAQGSYCSKSALHHSLLNFAQGVANEHAISVHLQASRCKPWQLRLVQSSGASLGTCTL